MIFQRLLKNPFAQGKKCGGIGIVILTGRFLSADEYLVNGTVYRAATVLHNPSYPSEPEIHTENENQNGRKRYQP
ncbi:MAG: hypothetical protein E7463_08850 [Ruminococcaceae bacterium]|nr:hypothetical protein [Oscillospiraceae bacterium]